MTSISILTSSIQLDTVRRLIISFSKRRRLLLGIHRFVICEQKSLSPPALIVPQRVTWAM